MKITIYRPVKSNTLVQGFGESLACVKTKNGTPIRPFIVNSKVGLVCLPDSTDFYTAIGLKGHNGQDWATWRGEPCYFPVISSEPMSWWAKNEKDPDGGIGVDVISDKPITLPDGRESYIKFRFWHLQKSLVADKEAVTGGQIIGLCDSTGASGGDHLHFAMKLCDMSGNGIETYNGYSGCIDHAPMMKNLFILDAQKAVQAYTDLVTSINDSVKKRELTPTERLVVALKQLFANLFYQ